MALSHDLNLMATWKSENPGIHLLGLPLQSTLNKVAETAEMYHLTVLKVRDQRSRVSRVGSFPVL